MAELQDTVASMKTAMETSEAERMRAERDKDEAEAALEAAAEAAAVQDVLGAPAPTAASASSGRVRELEAALAKERVRIKELHEEQEELLICVAEQDRLLEVARRRRRSSVTNWRPTRRGLSLRRRSQMGRVVIIMSRRRQCRSRRRVRLGQRPICLHCLVEKSINYSEPKNTLIAHIRQLSLTTLHVNALTLKELTRPRRRWWPTNADACPITLGAGPLQLWRRRSRILGAAL